MAAHSHTPALTGQSGARDIDRKAPVPMYHQLKRRIIEDINRLGMRPGDLLPGEHKLCERFGVSRTVVRQALLQLEHQGVIERVKGKGTFVAHQKTAESLVHTLTGLYEEVAARGGHVHSDVRRQETIPAEDDVADALGVAPGTPVVVIERLRYVDDEPWSWTTTYLPHEVGSLVLHDDLRDQSLYALLATHGIRAVRGMRSAEATSADAAQGALLAVGAGQALLVLKSVSYDETDRPMEYFVAYHRGDRSRFEFQLRASSTEESTASLRHTGLQGAEAPPPTL
ncbi:GntR family transcriptional regulator [Cryobacterium psychrotolerans]|uniref:GntR family transcriptional regulator n=1 Tax=Cryobacterium psychrotolerans TaxID=386301 RepID=A0A1G9ESZ1_9MICO|nr:MULTISPECIES: GntR family transcriptional regulator [Cryobacterium]TFD41972.1 GntR family transcriptional regulator [Cryobacterium sp. TMT1-2-1]TFD83630.1 GntR family transcriptional regulator [Cryobacterium psychrotolerans]SDK79224.1 GntR family transcriptional regulator [Cryobacterium psychrotolerans]